MRSTNFCPSCGAEYLAGVLECADCHVPLGGDATTPTETVTAPTTTPAMATELSSDGSEEVVFDLADWGTDDRMQLERLLTGEGITHRWEVVSDLVVFEKDADVVEGLLDDVEAAGDAPPLPAIDDEADDGNDEANYAVMSDLFVAADVLQKDASDAANAGEFFVAAEAVASTPAPFGIDRLEWQQVQELAASIAAALESDADDDVISGDAAMLRKLLSRYV